MFWDIDKMQTYERLAERDPHELAEQMVIMEEALEAVAEEMRELRGKVLRNDQLFGAVDDIVDVVERAELRRRAARYHKVH
jgi:hypothetical protein